MDDLHKVDAWLAALLANLEPAARTKMLREVARDVRRIQQQNMTAQRASDGTGWEPRKVTARTKPGRVRRKMFMKLKTAKYLKAISNADSATVQFETKVRRIALVHHYGLRDRLEQGRLIVKYSARPLIGVNREVESLIQKKLEKALLL